MSEINVIPLVDVMLVLLIIFMVAAPMLQSGIEVNLPVPRAQPEYSRAASLPRHPAVVPKDQRVFSRRTVSRLGSLPERLRQRFAGKPEEAQVFIRSDAELKVQHLISVFDALKAANVQYRRYRDGAAASSIDRNEGAFEEAMTESVTDIIVARARRQEPMTPMVVMSAVGHVVVFALLLSCR